MEVGKNFQEEMIKTLVTMISTVVSKGDSVEIFHEHNWVRVVEHFITMEDKYGYKVG